MTIKPKTGKCIKSKWTFDPLFPEYKFKSISI